MVDGEQVVKNWTAYSSIKNFPKGLPRNLNDCEYPPVADEKWVTFTAPDEKSLRLALKSYIESYTAQHSSLDFTEVDSKMRRLWRMRTLKCEKTDKSTDFNHVSLFDESDSDW